MNTNVSTPNLQNLKRSNTELKKALRHFIDSAPNYGPLAAQIENIRSALKSNEAVFTFASLVEQYAKMKKNLDNVDYQAQQRDLKALKATLNKALTKNLSTEQLSKINDILEDIAINEPLHSILAKTGRAISSFSSNLSALRDDSNVIVSTNDMDTSETDVVAADIHLASKRLVKDVTVISRQLAKTYPTDEFISNLLEEAEKIPTNKGIFFKSINLLERTTTYLALLIQKERYATEEMLNDIHVNLVEAFNKTTVIEQLLMSSQEESQGMKNNMGLQLKNMEVKARSINTIEDMQQHIKDNVSLLSQIMNDYANTQHSIHQNNEATIQELNAKIESTTTFVDKLEKKLNIAEETSLVDELTTVGNRKGYVYRINKERKDRIITEQPLSLMVLDIDSFKNINDSFGHSIGDQVLKCLGQTLQKNIRSTDYVARYGGEEFVIILPATDIKKSIKIAQKIREVINSLKFELRRKSKVLRITCSFGIAGFSDKSINTVDVFNVADKALYHAKSVGKDCIVASQNDEFSVFGNEKEIN